MLLLLHHVLLCLQLLLLLVVQKLLVIVVNLVALLLRDVNVRVLLQDLSELINFHVFEEQRLLLKLLWHLLLIELRLVVDLGHRHTVLLHGNVLLLHFWEVRDLLIRWHLLALRDVLTDLWLRLHLALHRLHVDLRYRLLTHHTWDVRLAHLHGLLHLSLHILLPLYLVWLLGNLLRDVRSLLQRLAGLHWHLLWLWGLWRVQRLARSNDVRRLLLFDEFLSFSSLCVRFFAFKLFLILLDASLNVGFKFSADFNGQLVEHKLARTFTLSGPLLDNFYNTVFLLWVQRLNWIPQKSNLLRCHFLLHELGRSRLCSRHRCCLLLLGCVPRLFSISLLHRRSYWSGRNDWSLTLEGRSQRLL